MLIFEKNSKLYVLNKKKINQKDIIDQFVIDVYQFLDTSSKNGVKHLTPNDIEKFLYEHLNIHEKALPNLRNQIDALLLEFERQDILRYKGYIK